MPSVRALFDNHSTDLKIVRPGTGDKFMCPICCAEFSRDDTDRLSIGHVWPKYIREKSGSRVACRQVVLLCKSCNSMAGSRGEKQMQLGEMVKDGDKVGTVYGERRTRVLLAPGEEPIDLRAAISLQEGEAAVRVRMAFMVDRTTGKWARNDPREQERFRSVELDRAISAMLIYPHHELRAGLPHAGWLTSAYLLAFYTLGYRYILNKSLDPVREYILSSLQCTSEEVLQFPQSDEIAL